MNRKGFTLIEIIMVLALAGLIMILVFYAVAQGNKYRRDGDRQAAAAKYLAATKQWISDNDGVIPSNIAPNAGTINGTSGSVAFSDPSVGIAAKYIKANGESFTNPEGDDWVPLWQAGAVTGPGNLDKIYVYNGICSSGNAITLDIDANSRRIAVAIEEEGGQSYCISS